MKKIISFILVLAMPFLMACGATKTVAEAAPTPESAVMAQSASSDSQPTGEPRWTPPQAETQVPLNEASVEQANDVVEQQTAEQEAPDEEQAFPKVGVPSGQVLEILGKPDRSELGQNSRHLYNNYGYKGIQFKSVEVDMTNDGTVWLINLVAEDTTELDDLKAFVQAWANQISTEYGTPGISQFDNPLSLNYDWRDVSLQLATYPGMTEYHIGLFWKLF